ncbi:MAG: endonuclease/exonuclease/phosphatase family protein [Patescibacteria group bacterium]
MKIIFLNTWDCEIKKGVGEFLKKQSRDTEIFCLQEADKKTIPLCVKILYGYNLTTEYKYVDKNDIFPLATYVRKNIEIETTNSFLKSINRIGLALHTQLKYKGKIINICNVHGVCKPGDKKDNQNRLLQTQEIIRAYQKLDGLKIIGGDFNLDADTKSVKLFENNGYINLIKKHQIPTTRNRLIWDKFPNNKQYFSDYVFVSPSLKVKTFSVPNIEISDHLPMILEFDL